jgi:hypothetical protein
MATALQPVAKCVISALYELGADKLDELRALVESGIAYADAQILVLKSQVAEADIMSYVIGKQWDLIQLAIDEFNSKLGQGIGAMFGDKYDLCPELYHYLVDPFIGMNKSFQAAFFPYKDKYAKYLSFSYWLNELLEYWELIKSQLIAILDVLDDALYYASEQAGNRVP